MNLKCFKNIFSIVTLQLFVFLLVICLPLAAGAETRTEEDTGAFTLYWENDTFVGTDRDYTNGMQLTWSSPFIDTFSSSRLPDWSSPIMARLPFMKGPGRKRAVSLSIGQVIYTPEDTESSELVVDDRPYAGYTYLAAGFHSKTSYRKYTWGFNIGIVGPHSYAEDVQNWAHDWIGSPRAKGWDHQLQDEIGVDIMFDTQWRLFQVDVGHDFGCDFISHLGGSLGNVNTYANAGAELRFGWNLPRDFGTCPIRAGCESGNADRNEHDLGSPAESRVGFHFFMGVDGRAVIRDIFLDGNTFKDSHSVDKEPFVADLIAGCSFEYNIFKLYYYYVFRTKQFTTQKNDQIFGAVSMSVTF